jgi:hypothetical protein
MIEHFDYLADHYFNQPGYLRIDGRPVVLFYVVRDMTNGAPYFKLLRERMQKRKLELYLIADVLWWSDPEKIDWPFLQQYFQALTGYNMYDPSRAGTNFLAEIRGQMENTKRLAAPRGLTVLPTVMAGYDDRALRGGNRSSLSFWDLATRHVGDGQRLLLINSFNEWHEGTEIEPSMEWNDAYLSLTRELIDQTRSNLNLSENKVP